MVNKTLTYKSRYSVEKNYILKNASDYKLHSCNRLILNFIIHKHSIYNNIDESIQKKEKKGLVKKPKLFTTTTSLKCTLFHVYYNFVETIFYF